jgi:hypothetical protein
VKQDRTVSGWKRKRRRCGVSVDVLVEKRESMEQSWSLSRLKVVST